MTARPAIEHRLRKLFPRHHLQDDFSHIATIAAVVIAVVGFLVGLFPGLGGQVYGLTWLLFAIFVVLFLMLRESTLSHTRESRPTDRASDGRNGGSTRYHATRTQSPSETSKPEAARAESSNPGPTPPKRKPAR